MDDSALATHEIMRNGLTDILGALLSSGVLEGQGKLDETNIKWLYRMAGPQMKDDDPAVQKKSYKLIASMCTSHPRFFAQNWKEIIASITEVCICDYPSSFAKEFRCPFLNVPIW